ncbi:MAG: nucleoside deaminase [Saprospiraceae bacterium]|nr:nucleoside deaminase [Saprospiraceae bacterium]MDW8230841.1 nucleoside deaminase [Saprospiraceae bacterium]
MQEHASVHESFMRLAIEQARCGMANGEGGPFGAVVVKDGQVIAVGNNRVTSTNDPTAHAEIVAIREACRRLGSFQLEGCVLYTSCEPCPMCLGAIYWARPARVFFGCTRHDAAAIDFDDAFIYQEMAAPLQERRIEMTPLLREEALAVFALWREKADKVRY